MISNRPAHAIVDSGTSLIAGPFFEVQRLLMHLRVAQDCSNVPSLPSMGACVCARIPDFRDRIEVGWVAC